VRSVGAFGNAQDPDWGNIEIAVYDLTSGATKRVVLHRHLEQDDHNNPALLALPGGRLLAMYSKHGQDRKIYYRLSEPGDPPRWGPFGFPPHLLYREPIQSNWAAMAR
jgi:hypothetical protein